VDNERVIEEILKHKKVLKKEENSQDAVLDALRLLDEAKITKKILKITGIGKAIAKLSKRTEDEKVGKVAKKLLKKLKEMVANEKEGSKNEANKESVLDKNTMTNSNSNTIPSDPRRSKVCELLMAAFADGEGDDVKVKKQEVAIEIEDSMFQLYKQDPKSKDYAAKFRSLKFNLSKNKELRADLLTGSVQPKTVVSMTAEELADPEKRKAMEKAKEDIFNQNRSDWLDANRDNINKTAGIKQVGGLFACEECKSTKTTHYQKQTRGADEPMTVFAQCTDCGYRWRFGDH